MCFQIIKQEQPKQWTNYWMKEKQPLYESQPPRSSSRTQATRPHSEIKAQYSVLISCDMFNSGISLSDISTFQWHDCSPTSSSIEAARTQILNDFMLRRYFLTSNHRSSDVMKSHRSAFTLRLTTPVMLPKLFKSAPVHPPCSRTLMHPSGLVISRLERLTCDWKVGSNPNQIKRFTRISQLCF